MRDGPYPRLDKLRQEQRASVTPISGGGGLRPAVGRPRHRRKLRWGRIVIIIVVIILLFGGFIGYKVLATSASVFGANGQTSIFSQIKRLIFPGGEKLLGEEDGQVNVLLLGIGGNGHKGGSLADTIIVASIRPEDGQVALLSIPRDLYVYSSDLESYTKINATHAYGEEMEYEPGGGVGLIGKTVKEVTGLPLHYYIRLDFEGFKNIIDELGGIDINIERSFYDYFHEISYPQGSENMDGERSLYYVRARYVEGPEGGDFARARRTQQVLQAVRDKALSITTIIDIRRLSNLLDQIEGHARTDLELWEMKRLFNIAQDVNDESVSNIVLQTGPNGVLVGDTVILGGEPASVLKPKAEDFSEIHTLVQNLFAQPSTKTSEPVSTPTPTSTPGKAETATIEIQNGTNTTGLAAHAKSLAEDPIEIEKIGNAANRPQAETIMYDYTGDKKPVTQKQLEKIYGVTEVKGPEDGIRTGAADFVIILGDDFSKANEKDL